MDLEEHKMEIVNFYIILIKFYQVALKCPNTDKVFELSSKTEEIEVLKQKDKSALSLIERIAIATYDPYN